MSIYRLFIVLTFALATTSAHADTSDDALVEKGLQLRRNRQDAEALVLFRQAYEARPTPRVRAQIALAEQALAKWAEAEHDLLLALAVSNDPWITSHRETLEKALETIQRHLGTLAVETNAPNAELWLNGAQVGALPIGALRVVAGPVRLEVRAEGYEPATRSVEISPGVTATEKFDLTATPKIDTPAPETVTSVRTPRPTESSPAQGTTNLSLATDTATMRRTFAWGTLGAAGAFLGGAVVAQVIRETNAARYNDDSRCLYGDLSRDERCGVYRGQAESAQGLANIGYVAAGALGVASAILFWSSAPSPKTSGVNFWFDVGSSGAELTVRGKL